MFDGVCPRKRVCLDRRPVLTLEIARWLASLLPSSRVFHRRCRSWLTRSKEDRSDLLTSILGIVDSLVKEKGLAHTGD
jgi:hypothetical protein